MTNLKDALGERMKGYESVTKSTLPERSYTLVRLDGRAFHTYLRGAQKPFDYQFAADMQETARMLCAEMAGSVFAYTQSDEISILLQDFASPGTQPWFGGEVQKIVSVSASMATARMNALRGGKLATFDSRVFTVPSSTEVANYFLWRQKDAIRNAVSMAAQAEFSHNELQGEGQSTMLLMLEKECGIVFDDVYPAHVRFGSVVVQVQEQRAVEYLDKRTDSLVADLALRKVWTVEAAPRFSATEGWLLDVIPERS